MSSIIDSEAAAAAAATNEWQIGRTLGEGTFAVLVDHKSCSREDELNHEDLERVLRSRILQMMDRRDHEIFMYLHQKYIIPENFIQEALKESE
ncbi:MAG: hypothetical protein MHMPM18_004016, partial [Marteilia pararefringens]